MSDTFDRGDLLRSSITRSTIQNTAGPRLDASSKNEETLVDNTVSLLQTGYTTIACCFPGSSKRYVYKTALKDLAIGDIVVVPVEDRHEGNAFKCVKVVEVHDVPRIIETTPWTYKWAIQRIEVEEYERILKSQADLEAALESALFEAKRAQVVESLPPAARSRLELIDKSVSRPPAVQPKVVDTCAGPDHKD